jgi:hypothetical protein
MASVSNPPPLVKQLSVDLDTLEADDEFEEFERNYQGYNFR